MTRIRVIQGGVWVVLAVLLGWMAISGGRPLHLADVWSGEGLDRTILIHFRAPRLLLAALCGASLGVAGTILQTMLRNPLAAPDVIGFSAGASAGAACAILAGGSLAFAGAGAVLGGLGAAVFVLGFAWRGGMAPLSLILIGVALSLMLTAATDVVLSLAPSVQAGEMTRFLSGSFADAQWRKVALMAGVLCVAGLGAAWLGFAIDRLEMGDDMARALGLRPTHVRASVTVISVVLTAGSVAVAGPLPFVAFLAGPLARRLADTAGTALGLSAAIGALMALGADAASMSDIGGTKLPAGVFTALIGGPVMLIVLLRREGAH